MKKTSKGSESTMVNPIPEGFHTVTPYLVVNGGSKLIDFLTKAFDAEVTSRLDGENNTITHATIRIGDSAVMIADTMENFPATPAMLYLYVTDVDKSYKRALDAGGKSVREPTDEFYGDRSAGVKDAWGNQWWVATHQEDVSHEELKKRQQAFRNN